mmetsp:Transcript_2390/g.4598  ORF Transcript_2390/g.4598 Transcript_2390/m.4598 type:complete len:201 (-) Transcript_2390:1216-1818(-)
MARVELARQRRVHAQEAPDERDEYCWVLLVHDVLLVDELAQLWVPCLENLEHVLHTLVRLVEVEDLLELVRGLLWENFHEKLQEDQSTAHIAGEVPDVSYLGLPCFEGPSILALIPFDTEITQLKVYPHQDDVLLRCTGEFLECPRLCERENPARIIEPHTAHVWCVRLGDIFQLLLKVLQQRLTDIQERIKGKLVSEPT